MILKLTQTGDPVLRHPARALTREEILSPEIQETISAMFEAVRAAPGVGLAAPQVGIGLQIAVIEDRAEYIEKMPAGHASERGRVPVPAHVIINPHLEIERGDTVSFFEGCLSLPGFTAVVPRARRVRVDCLNERAEPVTIHAEGWYARILQHEIDHLHGALYIDRMLSRTFMTRERFEADWKDFPVPETLSRLLS
jgi:peptide deformylase